MNGMEGLHAWLAPADDVDEEELIHLFEENGFPVEKCDGIAEDMEDIEDN